MKRLCNIYVDSEAIEILKAKGYVISHFINNILCVEAEINLETRGTLAEELVKMKISNGKLMEIIAEKDKEIAKMTKQLKEIAEKDKKNGKIVYEWGN